MTETRAAMRKLTFNDGLPIGTRATFKEDGELWIAIPMKKYTEILTVTDRLLGAVWAIKTECLYWLNAWPTDGARVARVLKIISSCQKLAQEAGVDKMVAETQ